MTAAAPSRPRPLLAAGAVLAAAAGAATLFRFDPLAAGFYPRCPVLLTTGFYCPGCGTARALHALLHGDVGGALGFHPLLVPALPVLAAFALSLLSRLALGRPLPLPRLSARAAWGVLAMIALFTVLRNLPVEPFSRLAP